MMTLTKEDLGPKRRLFDKGVRYMVAFMIGWTMADMVYRVDAIPALKSNSVAWYSATADKFAGICDAIYGPKKTPSAQASER